MILYLLRHAKSSWEFFDLPDHDRPLAPRGKRAAKAMARHLREQGIVPELVLCSTATRARETLERVGLGDGNVAFESGLYGASAATLLRRLDDVDAESVMLVGHNPGLHDLALRMLRNPPAELEAKFPTGALVAMELGDDGTAELLEFTRPRDLER
jgi:phosphohistidine phosphatase